MKSKKCLQFLLYLRGRVGTKKKKNSKQKIPFPCAIIFDMMLFVVFVLMAYYYVYYYELQMTAGINI